MAVPTNTDNPRIISASGESNGVLIPVNTSIPDAVMTLRAAGTYGTGVLVARARLAGVYDSSDGSVGTYGAIAGVDALSNAAVGTGGTITLTDNTTYTFVFPVAPYDFIEVYASALASGAIVVSRVFTPPSAAPAPVVNATTSTASLSGATTVTSTSANAFDVGANGATNPVLQVDASTGSVATGIKLKGAAAAGGAAVSVISSGADENLTIDAKGTGTVTVNATATGAITLTRAVTCSSTLAAAATTVSSTSASALTVGANGATNPVLKVNANTGSVATGVSVTGAAAASGVAVAAISSGTDEKLSVDAKGAGVLALNDTGTGPVYANRGALKALQVGLTLTALGTAQSSTPTSAQLLGGFLTQTGSTGAGAITLPTGTALSAACARTPATGDSFECVIANLGGGQTLTVTGATGTTVISGGAIATAKTAVAKFICTGSNAWSIAVAGG